MHVEPSIRTLQLENSQDTVSLDAWYDAWYDAFEDDFAEEVLPDAARLELEVDLERDLSEFWGHDWMCLKRPSGYLHSRSPRPRP